MESLSRPAQGIPARRNISERAAACIVTACGFFAVLVVCSIAAYMVASGIPALYDIGIADVLFGTAWEPKGHPAQFGIFYVILTSLIGTGAAVLLAVPVGVLTAVFISEMASSRLAEAIRNAVGVLAAIPSVIFGLMGLMVLNPLMYELEQYIFRGQPDHQFTGGANLLSAILVLAIMILPTVINISEVSLRSVPQDIRNVSRALGATEIQTIFHVLLPAAKSGIITAVVLGTGRAIGEAMAISLVSGSAVHAPLPFNSVRFLTTAIVSEMGYASGLHREVLFTIGLVLFIFIMTINVVLTKVLKRGE
ncbi:phosphate ABC transporter permease subunit PstC [Megasphaera stantonii]|uniref:Phosphate transport system permease protein n=1 Tax=Megasphaera stantonii TaxID=2144175 RepID=A0A346B0S5_9FIRM|nr:phosphate ABC transporter permease subunit PstC [Megasphaera stantonii]AXL21718.1 phosphate ABC transporter permease subunit PstC [Megasphaera stantonii]